MSSSLTGGLLTFCRIEAFRRTSGIAFVRFKSGKPAYQDLKPEHEKEHEPDTVFSKAGPWKNYCTNDFYNKNKRRLDKDVFESAKVDKILKKMELQKFESKDDMPAENMPNPYVPKQKKCIICQYNVQLDYKNVQLLSQFVSPYTGRIYGRHVTGLCIHMQKTIASMIIKSRCLGFMAIHYTDMEYLEDPKLFHPFGKPKKSEFRQEDRRQQRRLGTPQRVESGNPLQTPPKLDSRILKRITNDTDKAEQ